MRANAQNVTIRQKPRATGAVKLLDFVLGDKAGCIKLTKNILSYLSLNRSRSAPELVKGNPKPAVNAVVYGIVTVAEFPGRNVFLGGFGLSGGAVLVGAAHIQRLIAPKSTKAGKHVGGKNLNKIPQMRNIVYIGERGCN